MLNGNAHLTYPDRSELAKRRLVWSVLLSGNDPLHRWAGRKTNLRSSDHRSTLLPLNYGHPLFYSPHLIHTPLLVPTTLPHSLQLKRRTSTPRSHLKSRHCDSTKHKSNCFSSLSEDFPSTTPEKSNLPLQLMQPGAGTANGACSCRIRGSTDDPKGCSSF